MDLRESNYDENGVDLSAPKVYETKPPKEYYNYDDNGELVSSGVSEVIRGEHIIPAKATVKSAPAQNAGLARVFDPDTERWSHVTDLRGDTIYDTESQREARVDYLGDLKEKHTKLKPPTRLHKFKNKKWDLSPDDHARDLERKLMNTVDGAHAAAQRLALGYKSTPRQIERYRDKYERAVKKEFSTELNKKIISKHKAYQETVGKRIDLIEVLRGRVATLIKEGQLDRAAKIIKQFDAREGGYALDSGLDEAEFAKEFEKITA